MTNEAQKKLNKATALFIHVTMQSGCQHSIDSWLGKVQKKVFRK